MGSRVHMVRRRKPGLHLLRIRHLHDLVARQLLAAWFRYGPVTSSRVIPQVGRRRAPVTPFIIDP